MFIGLLAACEEPAANEFSILRHHKLTDVDAPYLFHFIAQQPCKLLVRIDDDTLWSIIRDDVPELLPLLQTIKNEAQS